jgi:type IX secretion system PorP/SprF family membrane protein
MKNNFLFFLFLYVFILSAREGACQDIHFSQFMSSPMNLNPAQAGQFDGAFRFVGNARRQWNSVTIPYQTFGGSVDAKNLLRIKRVGAGLSIYNDRTGDSQLNTFQMNLALSYTFKINKDSTQFLTFGAQSGFTQRTINYSKLSYDNQYSGSVYDPNLPNNESFSNNGRLYPNLNAGILWTRRINERNVVMTGVSLNNINRPQQSFFNDQSIKLDQKLTVHLTSQFKLSRKIDILPAFLFLSQGKFKEFTVGASAKYILNEDRAHYRALYFGMWTRAADAGWLSAGMDYGNLYAGVSYDINYSKLTPASNARGGIELSVIYIIRELLPKRKSYKICPTYI